jgi:hypothetical protein
MAKEKERPKSNYREVKPKLGLHVRPLTNIGNPHDDLIKPESLPGQTSLPSQTSRESATQNQGVKLPGQTSHTRQTGLTSTIAPAKDFQKVANSISREAVPQGLFKGKSKQLYDYMYSQTRGAIIPTRRMRLTKKKLMVAAHIGSRNTFEGNMDWLLRVGLIQEFVIIGEKDGNEYEVFMPEEITLPGQTGQTRQTGQTEHAQKLVTLVTPETGQTRQTQVIESETASSEPKTSFKDMAKIDDEGAKVFERLQKLERDLTGANAGDWMKVAEALEERARKIASRTKTISDLPKLLAEDLRRESIRTESKPKQKGSKVIGPADFDVQLLEYARQVFEYGAGPDEVMESLQRLCALHQHERSQDELSRIIEQANIPAQ